MQFKLTLLFIHGAASTPLVWHLQLKRFNHATAIALAGHTAGSGLLSIEDYASFVEARIKGSHISSPVIVGHSMGGAIAIDLALRGIPMSGLVLVGTGARLKVHPQILKKIREDYPQACKLVAQWSVAAGTSLETVNSLAREMLKVNPRVAFGDFVACDTFDRMQSVQRIKCPTLIICGSMDRLTPVKYSTYLNEKITNSRLILIPDSGHSVMLEKYREFNEAVSTFLASL